MRYAHAMSQAADMPQHPVVVEMLPEILRAVESAMRDVAKEAGCTHMIVAIDSGIDSRRKGIYPEYKGKRTVNTTIWSNRLATYCNGRGIMTLRWPGEEADDVIATLVARLGKAQQECSVFSGDGDLLQLASLWCEVWQFGRPKEEAKYMRRSMSWITQKFGIEHVGQLRLYKALVGDPSDDLPGVKGIGAKKAAKIIAALPTAEMIRASGQVPVEQFDLMLSLVTLREDIPLDPMNAKECRIPPPFSRSSDE